MGTVENFFNYVKVLSRPGTALSPSEATPLGEADACMEAAPPTQAKTPPRDIIIMYSYYIMARTRRNYRKTEQEKKMKRIAGSAARKAVNKQIESKIWDGYIQADSLFSAIPATGHVYLMTFDYSTGAGVSIEQGTNQNEYIGFEIKPSYLMIRWAVNLSEEVASDNFNSVTVIVFQSKGSFAPTGSNMDNVFQLTNDISAPFSPTDRLFDERFNVLYRKTVSVDAYNYIRTGKAKIGYNKLKRIKFSNETGTIQDGQLYMGAVSDSTAGPHPKFRAYWRMHFKDA